MVAWETWSYQPVMLRVGTWTLWYCPALISPARGRSPTLNRQ